MAAGDVIFAGHGRCLFVVDGMRINLVFMRSWCVASENW